MWIRNDLKRNWMKTYSKRKNLIDFSLNENLTSTSRILVTLTNYFENQILKFSFPLTPNKVKLWLENILPSQKLIQFGCLILKTFTTISILSNLNDIDLQLKIHILDAVSLRSIIHETNIVNHEKHLTYLE